MKYKETRILKIRNVEVSLNSNLEVIAIYLIIRWYLFKHEKKNKVVLKQCKRQIHRGSN